MHNYYTYLYNKVVFETLKDKLGEGNVCYLPVRQQQEGSNSLSIGVAIVMQHMNRWLRVCAVDYRLVYAGLAFGVMISVVLKLLLQLTYLNAG